MIDNLIILIFLAATLQSDNGRRVAAFMFAVVALTHSMCMSDLDGFAYYGSAAMFDLALITILSKMNPITDIVIKLQRISLVSIGVNMLGWVMWYLYLSPVIYNVSFIFIYLWVTAVLLQRIKTSDDMEDSSVGGLCPGIRFNTAASL